MNSICCTSELCSQVQHDVMNWSDLTAQSSSGYMYRLYVPIEKQNVFVSRFYWRPCIGRQTYGNQLPQLTEVALG